MKEIPLTRGKVARIDDEDFERVNAHKWYAEPRGRCWYARARINGKLVYMHRFILGGPNDVETDHIDGDGLTNCRSNLRRCSGQQNKMNTRKRHGTTSRFKGVSWDSERQRWLVQVSKGGKHIYYKRFADELIAARAYNREALAAFGEFARLNTLVPG